MVCHSSVKQCRTDTTHSHESGAENQLASKPVAEPSTMNAVWLLAMCAVLVRGDIGAVTTMSDAIEALKRILPNHVMFGMADVVPLEDRVVTVSDRISLHLNHLHLLVSPNSQHLHVHLDLISSIIHFASTEGFINIVGDYKIRNGTTFLSKGMLNVSFTGLEVSGDTDLLLGEKSIFVHDFNAQYKYNDSDVKFVHKEENGTLETESVTSDSFLVSFEEVVHDEIIKVLNKRIQAILNNALSSVSISSLVGGDLEEHLYRSHGLVPIPHFNEILDTIFENLKPVVQSRGLDVIHLPDINTTFTVKESILKLYGKFLAENGTIHNMTSVHRTSDCMLAGNGTFFLVSGGVGMDVFNVTYNYVEATFEGVEFTGKISVSFELVSVLFKVVMTVSNSTCYPSLEFIRIDDLEKIHVEVEGQKAWLVKNIILAAFETYKAKIVASINALLQNLAAKNLKSFDCGNYFGN